MYNLPSWGRCELALSLLRDPGAPYTLEDVVQAVRESHDRDFIRRVLAKECPICLSLFPHSKVSGAHTHTHTAISLLYFLTFLFPPFPSFPALLVACNLLSFLLFLVFLFVLLRCSL